MRSKSTAVMQRRVEPHDSLDDFPTPPWATRAICERIGDVSSMTVREPCANRGYMVRPLSEYFSTVIASDIFDYGQGYKVEDYLFGPSKPVDWTFMNPPFRLAQQFIEKALDTSTQGVAVIVRSAFLEGIERFNSIYSVNPPSAVYQFSERVPMVKGRYDPKVSSATAYAWLVWEADCKHETRLRWVEPCRARLFRDHDEVAA